MASKAACLRHRWYTVRPIFASRIGVGLLRLPRFFSCRCIHAFAGGERPQHQARRLGERPLQVGVADLLRPPTPFTLPALSCAHAHQPRSTTGSCPTSGKRRDVVDLVEQDQAEDRADARDRAQEAEGHRVVDLGVLDQVQFQRGDLGVVVVDQGQVGGDRSAGCSGRSKRSAIAAVRLPA